MKICASVNHLIVSPAYSPIEYKVMHSLNAQMEFVVLSAIDELESGHHKPNPFYRLGT